MTCAAARDLFTRELDARLDPSGQDELAAHLATCAECRAERDLWRSIAARLRASGPSEVPAGIAAAAVRAALTSQRAPESLAPWFVGAARPAVLAAAAAALLVWAGALAVGRSDAGHEPAGQDQLELAVQLWTAEVPGDAP